MKNKIVQQNLSRLSFLIEEQGLTFGENSIPLYKCTYLFLFLNFIVIVDTTIDVPVSLCAHLHPAPHYPLAITLLLSVFMGYAYMFFG